MGIQITVNIPNGEFCKTKDETCQFFYQTELWPDGECLYLLELGEPGHRKLLNCPGLAVKPTNPTIATKGKVQGGTIEEWEAARVATVEWFNGIADNLNDILEAFDSLFAFCIYANSLQPSSEAEEDVCLHCVYNCDLSRDEEYLTPYNAAMLALKKAADSVENLIDDLRTFEIPTEPEKED